MLIKKLPALFEFIHTTSHKHKHTHTSKTKKRRNTKKEHEKGQQDTSVHCAAHIAVSSVLCEKYEALYKGDATAHIQIRAVLSLRILRILRS